MMILFIINLANKTVTKLFKKPIEIIDEEGVVLYNNEARDVFFDFLAEQTDAVDEAAENYVEIKFTSENSSGSILKMKFNNFIYLQLINEFNFKLNYKR